MASSRTKLSIGIAGVGAVGGTLKRWFELNTNHDLYLYDPEKGYNHDLSKAQVCFVSVPVPTNEDGTQDVSMLEDALSRCGEITFIRSTVLPGTNDKYKTYSCPEFLTERIALREMMRQPILTGCSDVGMMRQIFPNKKIIRLTNKECEVAKYGHNAMGAVKVNFFNLIFNLCRREKLNYSQVLKGILCSGYINRVHTQVPGPDKKRGFGGKCFPKDLRAFEQYFTAATFTACLEENKLHRGSGKADSPTGNKA